MGKNIVVFSDGTSQEGGLIRNTNVYKLFNMVEDRTENQITFYDKGLGTGRRKNSGAIFGRGMSKNILDCYWFIFDNYNAGDHVYLFGFSRGAATVRSLSGFIDQFGILPRSRPELIKRAYKIYQIPNHARRDRKSKESHLLNHAMWCKIKFLGVWDTVAALGSPIKWLDVLIDRIPKFRHRFHDFTLSPGVEHGRQALAIDDERLTFHPIIWNKKPNADQTIKQVWFCGMHSDVGGSYEDIGLSSIPLIWMVTEAKKEGLLIWPGNKVPISPKATGKLHSSRTGFPGVIYRRSERFWNHPTEANPTVHESVEMRKDNKDSEDIPKYDPWILQGAHGVEFWPAALQGINHLR